MRVVNTNMRLDKLIKQQKESNARSVLLHRLFDMQRTRTYEFRLAVEKLTHQDWETLANPYCSAMDLRHWFQQIVGKDDNSIKRKYQRALQTKEAFEKAGGEYNKKFYKPDSRIYENLSPSSMANRLQKLVKNKPKSTKKLIKQLRARAKQITFKESLISNT